MTYSNTQNLLKVRAYLLKSSRAWFDNSGYTETQGPILLPTEGKSPISLEVDYFGKKAYLSKGFLPYGKYFSDMLGKVYTITPSFRKEQVSKRHLIEYWRIEGITPCGFDDCLSAQEELISFICNSLSSFEVTKNNLKRVQRPFNRLTYDQAINILQADGYNILWGQAIDWEFERHLSLKFNNPFFVIKYPIGCASFLHKQDSDRPELSLSADLIAPGGYGEIASSMEMLTKKEAIRTLAKEATLSNKQTNWLLNLVNVKALADPCSVFAIGIERLLMWLCEIPNVKDTVPFPRIPRHDAFR